MKPRTLRRTTCIECSVPLTDETGYRKGAHGWHSHCRACRAVSRRRRHEEQDAASRLFVTRDVCDICKQPERVKRNGVVRQLNRDHDHTTGEWRGLLCSRCNQAIGMLSDNPELLRLAAGYLENPPGLALLDDAPPETRQEWRKHVKGGSDAHSN